jgi:hypothetical protein
MPALNPKQFDPQFGDGLYHGTSKVIHGEHVLPAYRTDHKTVNYGQSNPNLAYATEDEDTAWELPASANNRPGTARMAGRIRVHELQPNKSMEPGRYHPDHENFSGENLAEWVAPKFKVTNTLDIKPGQQGTFPSLNWNQFAKQGAPTPFSDNFNHPDDHEIEHGHAGGDLYRKNLLNWSTGGPDQQRNSEEVEGAKYVHGINEANQRHQGRLF